MKLRYGTPEEAGMSAQRLKHITKLTESWVANGFTSAIVILVARRGIIAIHEAFGRLAPEPDSLPVERDTIYPIASISKPITATAVMILVEEGLLGINRPVSFYIPEFAGKDNVMIHHLMTHTSGLRDADLDVYANEKMKADGIQQIDKTKPLSFEKYLSLRYDAPLTKPPGTEMFYCNYGYNLLGEIIRRVSGRSIEDFSRERIFEPLGMKDTTFIVTDSMKDRIVKRPPGVPNADWLEDPEWQKMPFASGGAYSTAMDMAIFGQMFLNRGIYGDVRILSSASVSEMTRNQIPTTSANYDDKIFHDVPWGFGWNVHGNKKYLGSGSLHSPEAFSHGGAGGVFLWIDPVYEIVGVCFTVDLGKKAEGFVDLLDLFVNAVTATPFIN